VNLRGDRGKKAVEYLTSKGWRADAVFDLVSAIQFIQKYQPNFAIININFKNRAILKLPKLLERAFQIVCIVCNDDKGPLAQANLQKTGMVSIIHGTAKGANFHLKISELLHKVDWAPNYGQVYYALRHPQITGQLEGYADQSDEIQATLKLFQTAKNKNLELADEPLAFQEKHTSQITTDDLGSCAVLFKVKFSQFSGFLFLGQRESALRSQTSLELLYNIKQYIPQINYGNFSDRPHSFDHANLEQIDMSDWALPYAQLIMLEVSNKNKVVTGYLSQEERDIAAKHQSKEEMSPVPIHKLDSTLPLGFDLYVHLEKNKKFVRYVASGQRIQASQLEALKKYNKKVYCQTSEWDCFRSDFAKSTLKNRISVFPDVF